jgi:hypothetical protein
MIVIWQLNSSNFGRVVWPQVAEEEEEEALYNYIYIGNYQ